MCLKKFQGFFHLRLIDPPALTFPATFSHFTDPVVSTLPLTLPHFTDPVASMPFPTRSTRPSSLSLAARSPTIHGSARQVRGATCIPSALEAPRFAAGRQAILTNTSKGQSRNDLLRSEINHNPPRSLCWFDSHSTRIRRRCATQHPPHRRRRHGLL